MALGNLFAKKPVKAAPVKAPVADDEQESLERGLPSLFTKGIQMQKEREDLLRKSLEDGMAFFQEFNNARLKLAFESFTVDMKKALFEVLFFLHVNDPKYSEVKFTGVEVEHVYGITREHEYEASANLYLEGAPHGVEGIEELPEVFRAEFFEFIQKEFGTRPSASDVKDFCPFVSISSLGSVGTVGHKPISSDLDMQVQYEMEPFLIDPSNWDDDKLTEALKREIQYWMQLIRVKKKVPAEQLKNPKVQQELQRMAKEQVKKNFPQLYQYLLAKTADYRKDLMTPNGPKIRQLLLHEMMELIKRSNRREKGEKFLQAKQELLKKKALTVQDYIQKKYPHAEIYLFVCDNELFRKGYHGTTLESKEASGSAYEHILSYDVLMPGIQFTPMVPSHFVLPKVMNDSSEFYDRTMDYIRFNVVSLYSQASRRLANLGATPRLPLQYILSHGGAIYWEAFKASSGNLAKALLNLFRIEMLHEPKFLIMIIEMIKNPTVLDQFIENPPDDVKTIRQTEFGLCPWELVEMEQTHKLLIKDPWWLKYKALKIAFGELQYLKEDDRKRISKIIDICFGLHVKVSEVFIKPGDTRKFETYREQFLIDFLRRAFPEGSPQRKFLEHVNMGETKAVIEYENEMRYLFESCIERVLDIQNRHGLPDDSNQKEFEIWYHYYQKNFEPPPNMVRKSILHHLKVPRLRLQAGFNPNTKMWTFRSLQTESKLGKRFDTFGVLDHLPDEVDLIVNKSFTYGLADTILNSYYGYVNKGSLKEQKTVLEFDSSNMKYGDPTDQRLAYVRPDNVARLADKITEFFYYRTYHYMDSVSVPKHYLEVFFLLHFMRFGRLSILYRDNLTNWYLDEFDIKDLKIMANQLNGNYQHTFKVKAFHQVVAKFLKDHNIDLTDEKVKTTFWLNPNSALTTHAANKVTAKEDDLSAAFKSAIYKVHTRKSE
ncbi:MAG: hypothetical protein HQM11_03125 [SAR324 cluster bacterium]|nr:hypothetical protein [SAR324 cluster bacterium]